MGTDSGSGPGTMSGGQERVHPCSGPGGRGAPAAPPYRGAGRGDPLSGSAVTSPGILAFHHGSATNPGPMCDSVWTTGQWHLGGIIRDADQGLPAAALLRVPPRVCAGALGSSWCAPWHSAGRHGLPRGERTGGASCLRALSGLGRCSGLRLSVGSGHVGLVMSKATGHLASLGSPSR